MYVQRLQYLHKGPVINIALKRKSMIEQHSDFEAMCSGRSQDKTNFLQNWIGHNTTQVYSSTEPLILTKVNEAAEKVWSHVIHM